MTSGDTSTDTPRGSSTGSGTGVVSVGLFVAALLLACINLPAPFVAVGQVAGAIRDGLGISAAQVGLLTSIPVLPLGLLLAPDQFLLFTALGGVGQGGGFASLLTVVAVAAGSARQASALSAFVQGVGDTVAALAPPALGLAHDLTAGWSLPLVLLVGTAASFGIITAMHGGGGRAARAAR
jgi:cyanate permease